MSMSDNTEAQERAAFEKAMAAEGYELDPQQYRDGTYRESYYAAGWAMWQARAALAQQAATPTLTDEQIDALDTFSLHWMAPRQRDSVREFARAVLAAARQAATPAPAEPNEVHPQSLRGLVESCGGNYLTGGGVAFTSAALAKFVAATAEAAVDDHTLTAAPPATPAAQPIRDLSHEIEFADGMDDDTPAAPPAAQAGDALPPPDADMPLGKIAKEAFDDYWCEDNKGDNDEAWEDAAQAVCAALAARGQAVPAGWRAVHVNERFDDLMSALDRADRKGYMPDAIADHWDAFLYHDATEGAAPAAPKGGAA